MLRGSAHDMAARIGPRTVMIEYGTGSGRKTALLMDALEPAAYVAIDISSEPLREAISTLAKQFPNVRVIAMCADYTRALNLPELDGLATRRRVVFFPGSTIGNFTPDDAQAFLRN